MKKLLLVTLFLLPLAIIAQHKTNYRLTQQNDPVLQVAYRPDTVLAKGLILANPYLTVKIPGATGNPGWRVVSYDCYITQKKGEKFSFSGAGSKLTAEVIAAIKNLAAGDRILFDNVKVLGTASGNAKVIQPITITIQ